MQKTVLTGEKRTQSGRKVKKLRSSGFIPATVYGRGVKSLSLSLATADFKKTYTKTGNTGLIDLTIGKEVRPVLVHRVQLHPVTDTVIHIEFHQVDLKENVHAKIPLVLNGVSPAVEQKLGVLLTVADEVEVEALPTDLPENISVDVTKLVEVGQELRVSDLKVPKAVSILTAPTVTIAKIEPIVVHEEEKKEEVPAEGEEVSEEGKAVEEEKGTKEAGESSKPTAEEK